MVRPLRIEFAGALYHVTARGNARADIYSDAQVGNHFGVSYATVSRAVKHAEKMECDVKCKA